MLPMRYLRTHVFSKQEKEFVETAMAFACQYNIKFHIFLNTPTSLSAESHRTIRRILSRCTGTKCRKLLLSATALPTGKLFKRRRKLVALLDHLCVKKLLYKYFIRQQYRSNRSASASYVPCISRQTERSSIRRVVPSHRLYERLTKHQFPSTTRSTSPFKINSNGLCTSAEKFNIRRRTPSNSMSHLALARLAKSGRYQKNSIMSQRTRSNLCMLQSSPLESAIKDR